MSVQEKKNRKVFPLLLMAENLPEISIPFKKKNSKRRLNTYLKLHNLSSSPNGQSRKPLHRYSRERQILDFRHLYWDVQRLSSEIKERHVRHFTGEIHRYCDLREMLQ